MDEQKKQLVAKLKEAQNVLVTVSKNPSVDQLAAAIGLALALNKLDKHATAVYSGTTPSTLEFLKPEETLEKNTDSLRDFIIALDKSKADKLRYKVEDQVVRIFITPYRVSISEKDLDFSQGDFNVDVVVALGVTSQQDLDDAIQAHGRILHDAIVSSITIDGPSELGVLNLTDTTVSSLSEVVATLVAELDSSVVDSQIATALLTGIVAMTDRFSNDRTSPATMSTSATLMSAGANQQLIAAELKAATPGVERSGDPDDSGEADSEDTAEPVEPGTLRIEHGEAEVGEDSVPAYEDGTDTVPPAELTPAESADKDQDIEEILREPEEPAAPEIHVDDEGRLVTSPDSQKHPTLGISDVHGVEEQKADELPAQPPLVNRERMVEPPSWNAALSANVTEETEDAPTEELTLPSVHTPILTHDSHAVPTQPEEGIRPRGEKTIQPLTRVEPPAAPTLPEMPSPDFIDTEKQTLSDIERTVESPHIVAEEPSAGVEAPLANVDDARSAVEAAFRGGTPNTPLQPIAALNAQPFGDPLHENDAIAPAATVFQPAPGFDTPTASPNDTVPGLPPVLPPAPPMPATTPPPPISVFPGNQTTQQQSAPPPPTVPPPMLPLA